MYVCMYVSARNLKTLEVAETTKVPALMKIVMMVIWYMVIHIKSILGKTVG